MNETIESLEKSFVACLHEIETRYISLPKSTRIRVEKWVEKFASTGGNVSWRRNRNMYAKLLLSMIIAKDLTEPFHLLPPDGPLAPLPSHLKARSRNSAGPHESVFWRELYNRMKRPQFEESSFDLDVENSKSSHLNKSLGSPSREILNLRLLIDEQAQRIAFLERQLQEERDAHDDEMQRLRDRHRDEVRRLHEIEVLNNSARSSIALSPLRQSHSSQRSPQISRYDVQPHHSCHSSNGSSTPDSQSEPRHPLSVEKFKSLSPEKISSTQKSRSSKAFETFADLARSSVPDDESEFMKYLENFQTQVRSLKFNNLESK